MKKIITSIIVTVMLVGTFSVAASAHGGSGYKKQVSPTYSECNVDDCTAIGPHLHSDSWYCNQTGVNWSDYEVCGIEGCGEIGLHDHDGQLYHCTNYLSVSKHCGNGYKRNCSK